MAEQAPDPTPGSAGTAGSTPGAVGPGSRRRRSRPLLAAASLLPLLLVGGALATRTAPEPVPAPPAEASASPGASIRSCHGPLQLPEAALDAGGDAELSVTPPTPAVSLSTVAVEPSSSVLFGTVSGSSTRQDDQGAVRAPSITAEDAEGETLEGDPAAQDLGVSVQSLRDVRTAPTVTAETSEGGRPVADVVQSTITRSGDFRSLASTRCAEPTTEASFLGVSTGSGDSSVLVLSNPSDRPATASVQVSTADGPAAMAGRSQVVVAPGAEERVLLESVVQGEDAVGVQVAVLGAPLAMHVRPPSGRAHPGGAEILDPLRPPAATEQVMPGVDVAGTAPTLVLANPTSTDTTADVQVLGPTGRSTRPRSGARDPGRRRGPHPRLDDLPDGSYSGAGHLRDGAQRGHPQRPQARTCPATPSARRWTSPRRPGARLGTHAVTALPAQGASGTSPSPPRTPAPVVPLAADGSAGEPIAVDLAAGTTRSLAHTDLQIGDEGAAALSIVPALPGSVHASWTQRQSDGDGGVLLTSLPVLPDAGGGETATVTLEDGA